MRSISFKITEKLTAGIELEAGFFSLDKITIIIFMIIITIIIT